MLVCAKPPGENRKANSAEQKGKRNKGKNKKKENRQNINTNTKDNSNINNKKILMKWSKLHPTVWIVTNGRL